MKTIVPQTGFSYNVSADKIKEYSRWPIEKRLEWLYEANRLRNLLPPAIIDLQEEFRSCGDEPAP